MPSTTFNSKPLTTNLTRHRRDGKCRTETLHGIVRAVAFPCDDAVIDGRTETPKHGNCILPKILFNQTVKELIYDDIFLLNLFQVASIK